MKKFISLVLALVMALSLTTIAWGAELKVGASETHTTIQAAVDAANPGDTIKVAAGTYDAFYIPDDKDGLTIEGTVEGGVLKTIVRTLYDTSPTFASNRCGGINIDAADVTLKNLAIQSEGYTNGRWYAAPIGHYYENVLDRTGFVVEGCTITNVATTKGGVAISFMVADITLKNNTITGYDNGWYSETGYNVDEITVTGNTFDITGNAINLVNSGTPAANSSITISGNTFTNGDVLIWDYANTTSKLNSAIKNVTLSGNTYGTGSDVILYDFKGGQADDVIDSDKAPVETYGTLANAVLLNPDATEVTIQYGTAREATYTEQSNGTWLGDNNIEYDAAGGNPKTVVAMIGNTTYETLAAAIAAANGAPIVLLDTSVTVPTSHTTLVTTDGTLVVVPAVTRGDKFDLYVADAGMKAALAAGAEDVPGLSFTEVAAKPNSDGSGNLAYIAASNGEYFVKTTNPTVADYAVTVAGKTDVLYYVSVVNVADVQYGATAKAFTNFGTKCGQLYRVDTTKEYYVIEKAEAGFALAKDDVSYVVKAGGVNVLVGNEIKTLAAAAVDDNNTVLTIDEILGHNWAVTGVKATTTGKTVPTQVTCLNCGAVVTKFYDAATKVPAGTVATAVPGYEQATNTHDAWFFVEPAAASVGGTVVTPDTDKVTSAETFDAGIAMYVGMSVMAASGSAVVLKKKD